MSELTNNSTNDAMGEVVSQAAESAAYESPQTPGVETGNENVSQPTGELTGDSDSFTKGIDPEKLAPELKQLYKSMQADYTRSKQQVKADLEELNQWRGLRQTKEFQEWAANIRKMQEKAAAKTSEQPDFDSMTDDEKIEYKLQEYKKQIDSKYEPFIQQVYMEKAQAILDKFLNDNPDAKEKLPEISQIINEYKLPIDKAWKIVKSDLAKPEAKQEVLKEMQVKKDANLQMPKLQPSQPNKTKVKDIFEAYEMAKKELEK